MYKSLFISLNIVGMLMVPILYIGDISITQSGDSQVNAGEDIEVTIDIDKEGVAGPARLKLDLTNAKGIEIEEIEAEGASFSYNKESALFIWYSIKSDSKITLKYKIIADADASGSKSITGSFSYLDEDERKKKDIQPFNFTVNGDGSVASNTDKEPIVIEGSDEQESVEVVTTNPNEENGGNNSSNSSNNEEIAENNTSEEVANNNSNANNSSGSSENNSTTNTDIEEDPIVVEGEDEDNTVEAVSTNTNSSTDSGNTAPDKVKCTRSIEKQGEDFIVTVSIYKGINGGFARVKEDIPLGFTATKIEAAGSIFKFADNSAKFLWSQIPKNVEDVVIKYKLSPPASSSGDYTIRGSFSAEFLIENEKPKKIKIATSTINVGGVLADNSSNNSTTENSSNNNSSSDNDNSTSNNNSNSNNNSTNNNSGSTTVGSSSTNGVKYRVQIIAAHNTVSKRYIKKAFGYNGAVNIDNHQGWVKYTTNGFKNYEEARNNRNSLNRYDFDGPFVTAYNNGDRITVQEALMLSNQSWMQ